MIKQLTNVVRLIRLGLLVMLSNVWLCMPTLAASSADVLNAVPVPPGAKLQIVSENAAHNGVPQAIATLHSSQSADDVLNFYRQSWAHNTDQASPGYVEPELPGWRLISHFINGYNVVVQLNASSVAQGASGFISVRAVSVKSRAPEHGPFAQLDMLSSNRSVDGNDTSLLRVYASALSVARSYRMYKDRLSREGWGVLSDSISQNNRVMVLSREQSRLELMFVPSREFASVLVVHKVTSQ